MELMTKKWKIDNIVKRWTRQYPDSKKDITERLIKEKPQTEEEVAEIIGNKSWTRNDCHECGEDSETTVVLGENLDYCSNTAFVCVKCINKAVDLINCK